MKTKERKNNKKGISLIILVITIIVIIILALAVILSINENNPIENARKAKFQNDLKTIQEEVDLYVANEYVEKNGRYTPESFTTETVPESISIPEEYAGKIEIVKGKVGITSLVGELEKIWANEIDVKENIPVIPIGFKYKEGTINTGYVIINETDENEFVWIPVDEMSTFVREDGYVANNTLQILVSSGKATEPFNFPDVITNESEIAEYNAMMKSVAKYGGFYIGRYEASDNGSGVAQSKANRTPWASIKWGESMSDLTGGAVEKARSVYPVEKAIEEGKAVSTLIYGVQWDAIVRWFKTNKKYFDPENDIDIARDSTNFGNYKNSTFTYIDKNETLKSKEENVNTRIPTGSTEYTKINNIYDLCRKCMGMDNGISCRNVSCLPWWLLW